VRYGASASGKTQHTRGRHTSAFSDCERKEGAEFQDAVNPGREASLSRPGVVSTLTPSDDNKNIPIHSFPSHIRFPASPSL
jgi:hypothetical protein